MIRFVLALLLSFAIVPLSACQTPLVNAEQTLIDEKAMYAAEAAYNLAAEAYITADAVGALAPDTKAKVKPIFAKAYEALKAARTAYSLSNAASFYEQTALVKQLANEAKALIPQN